MGPVGSHGPIKQSTAMCSKQQLQLHNSNAQECLSSVPAFDPA